MKCQKHLFNLPDNICYLNGAYMSPLLKRVEEAGIKAIVKNRSPFLCTHDDFFRPVEAVRQLYGKLINVKDTGRIVIIPSVSYGLANVSQNLNCKAGDQIILAGEQFPSNYYPWKWLADRKEIELVIILPPGGADRGLKWNERILDSINTNTRAVCIAHVHWADGTIFNLKEIRKALNRVDGALIIDATQSIGALPFDQEQIEADAIICAGYKWLMGPYPNLAIFDFTSNILVKVSSFSATLWP